MDYVLFAGWFSDVPPMYESIMDVLVDWKIWAAIVCAFVVMLALLWRDTKAQKREYERRLARQRKCEEAFSHLPEGERVIMVAKAIEAEKTLIRPRGEMP